MGWQANKLHWMELVDSSGQVELRRTVGAEFQICDFRFGPHTLRLGVNECFPLAVSNLEVRLGNPITLDVNLPKCAYGRPMYGSSTGELACFTYFRTTTGDGAPLSQVEISPKLGTTRPSPTLTVGCREYDRNKGNHIQETRLRTEDLACQLSRVRPPA